MRSEVRTMRHFLSAVLLGGVATFLAGAAYAQSGSWPNKPIRIVVPFPPGGIVDTVARQIQQRLQTALGQPLIIDNRGGAGGSVGAAEVARSTPDGYTLLMVFDSYATYPLVYPKLGFDVVRDLVPVTQLVSNPLILVVNPKLPANDLTALVRMMKDQPGQFNYASVGSGSSNHLTAELFKSVSETFATHIPYRGGGPAQQDLIGGQVDMMFLSAVLAQPHVKAGKLKALAQTGSTRATAYSNVPTVSEAGGAFKGFEVNSWVGMLAPAKTPYPIIERLNQEIRAVLSDPEFAGRLNEQGLSVIGNSPVQFATALKSEHDKWARLIRQQNLSLE